MKKILIITGSNRSKNISFTMAYQLVREFRKLDKNSTVEVLELAGMQLSGCCGNQKCAASEDIKCVYGDDDDFNMIYSKIEASDCVLFIVPKYAPYPSKFMQFLERIVAISWWGYKLKGEIEKFPFYKKLAGLICFANVAVTKEEVFLPLMESFNEIGFNVISKAPESKGFFINRAVDDEAAERKQIVKLVVEKLEET